MRTHKLLLTSALAFMLLGSAACTDADDMSGSAGMADDDGSAGRDPGPADPDEPNEPGNDDPSIAPGKDDPSSAPGKDDPSSEEPGAGNASGAASLAEALEMHADSERLNEEMLADDCGTDTCLEELDDLVAYIEDDCGDGCEPAIANFTEELNASQKNSGMIPTTFPSKRDLVQVVDDAAAVAPVDEGDEAKSEEPGDEADSAAAQDDAVANLVDELRAQAATSGDSNLVAWQDIRKMISAEADSPDEAREMVESIQNGLEDALAKADDPASQDLVEGDPVAPDAAAEAIEKAWEEHTATSR